jgi:hypothetical protein
MVIAPFLGLCCRKNGKSCKEKGNVIDCRIISEM